MPLSNDDVKYLQQAYKAGVARAAGMDHALDGAIGFSVAHVDKYSSDQTEWAVRRFREEKAWRRGTRINTTAMLRRLRHGELELSGMEFTRYFPGGPEEGEDTATGNVFTASGLTNLISLWTGLTGAAINPLHAVSAGTSVVGVGCGTAAAGTADTSLISNGGSAWYQAFDASSLGTTTTNGVVVGTVTVGSANGNFAWNEWTIATGSGVVTAGSNGSTVAGSPFATANSWAMLNHKTNVNLGSKASGSSWIFSVSFQIT